MHTAVRPYATAGVALVGASVIAVSPIAPPAPTIHIAAPHVSSASVDLTAVVNPITTWVQVITTALTNAVLLAQDALNPPLPILMQIIANQIGYAQELGAGIQAAITYIRTVTLNPQ